MNGPYEIGGLHELMSDASNELLRDMPEAFYKPTDESFWRLHRGCERYRIAIEFELFSHFKKE